MTSLSHGGVLATLTFKRRGGTRLPGENGLNLNRVILNSGGSTLNFSMNNESATGNNTASRPAIRWSVLLAAVAVTYLGMDLLVRRPLVRELSQVRTELASVEYKMEELVGVRNQVWETNNLLTSLRSQTRQLEDARGSLTAIQELCRRIDDEAGKTTGAFASLDRLVSLQNVVLKNTQNIDTAQDSLDRLVALQNQTVLAGEGTQDAEEAVHSLLKLRDAVAVESIEIDKAFTTVNQFGDLKRQVLNDGDGVKEAHDQLLSFIDLKNEIYNESSNVDFARNAASELIAIKNDLNKEAADVADAQQKADELVALKKGLVENGGNTETAFTHTEKLFNLRDTLNADMDLDGAGSNLRALVGIQNELNDQTQEVADAIETLELLSDLGEELQGQVDSIGGMRKSLMDIVLMESTVARVARIMGPLSELTNLRRMSDQDIREAARVVIENRGNRYARDSRQRRTASSKLKLDDVNLPAEDEQSTEDEPQDILVPEPRDEDIDNVIDNLE